MRSIHSLDLGLCNNTGLILFCWLACAACKIEGYYVPFDSYEGVDVDPPPSYWSARYGGPGEDRGARVAGIATAPNGDLVMAGTFEGTAELGGSTVTSVGSSDVWVARYRQDGSRIWSKRFGGSDHDDTYSVACDGDGNAYVSGSFFGPVDFGGGARMISFGAFLLKLDSNGDYLWDRALDLGGGGRAFGIATPDQASVALVGKFNGTVTFGDQTAVTAMSAADSFIAVYDARSGAHRWSRALARNPSSVNATSVGGDIVVVGDFTGTASLGGGALVAASPSPDIFLARYRTGDGAHVWSKRWGGTGTETAYAIGSDGTNVYVGGRFQGSSELGGEPLVADGTFYDAFAAKYSAADGGHFWSRRFGGVGHHDETQSMAVSSSKVAIGVSFSDSVLVGQQVVHAIGPTSDMMAIRIDPVTGSPLFASHFGSESLDDKLSLSYTGDHLVGLGTFQGDVDAFGVRLTGIGGNDIASFLVDY